MLWKHYHTPSTVQEALDLLRSYQGRAQVVAGGTDLLLDIRFGNVQAPEALVDITRIDELRQLEADDTTLYIGAGVTHAQIARSEVVRSRATCLAEGCGVVGGPQVRNVATLGGNVAHALPAADGTTALIALDAQAEVVLEGKRQWLPLHALYQGPGQSLLDHSRDLLLRFRVPLANAQEGSAFSRIMRPQGVALPILGGAAWVRLDEGGAHYQDVRICIGPVAKTPTRATAVEAVLRGQLVEDSTLERAINVALETLHPRTSKYRATKAYRQEMIAVILRRVLPRAVQRARSGAPAPQVRA